MGFMGFGFRVSGFGLFQGVHVNLGQLLVCSLPAEGVFLGFGLGSFAGFRV